MGPHTAFIAINDNVHKSAPMTVTHKEIYPYVRALASCQGCVAIGVEPPSQRLVVVVSLHAPHSEVAEATSQL